SQGDWRLYFLHRDRLEKVTAADVQRVAKEYLTRSNRTGGIFEPSDSPQRVPIPSTPEIAGMIGDYKGRQDVAQGEAFDSSPLAIEARLARSKLKSGVRVTLLPKKTRGASVDLRLTLRYGNLSVLKGKATAASYLPEMLVRGTKTRTRQQISDELDKNRAQLQLSGDSGVLSVVLQTKRENLLPSLQLIEDILRNPVFPSEELELLREEQIAAAGQQLTEPTAIARTEVQKRISIYPPDDPRYVATLAETIERTRDVKIDQIQLLYSELLGGANGELTIVGDFDAAEVTPVVDRITAGWKSAVPFERMPRESVNNEKGDYVEVNTPDKANAAYFAAMTLAMRDDHPDYPALAIGNFILGGGGLSSRLANRVRQKEGLSYTVQSALQASPIDERSVFYIFAISNPENSARVHTVIQEEIGMLLKDGVKDDEFQNAKTGYLKELEVRRSSDQSLAATLETYAFIGRDMKFVSDFEKKIQALTAEDVNQALKKYIQPKRLYIVSAGDFARVKGEKK
ncbi:MAG: insulinase family protein, partial [Planctomyces sp.]